MIKFEYSKAKYEFIVNNIIFNAPKKEREVFDLAVQGYSNSEIGMELGLCERSVTRRKKEINKKIMQLMS